MDREMKLLQREEAYKNCFQKEYDTDISIKNIFELFIITNNKTTQKWKLLKDL